MVSGRPRGPSQGIAAHQHALDLAIKPLLLSKHIDIPFSSSSSPFYLKMEKAIENHTSIKVQLPTNLNFRSNSYKKGGP